MCGALTPFWNLRKNRKKGTFILLLLSNKFPLLKILQFHVILLLYCSGSKSSRSSWCRWDRRGSSCFSLSFTRATTHTLRPRTARRRLLDSWTHNVRRACATDATEVSDSSRCRALNNWRGHCGSGRRSLMIISRAPFGCRHDCGAGYGGYDRWNCCLWLWQWRLTIGRAALRFARFLLLVRRLRTES